jgi:GntR family transcriptional regulator
VHELGSVDRLADAPPYRQIADQLRQAIQRGDLEPGGRVPSEAELIEHYGVARMTVRQAVAELKAEGLVIAEHGRGVFVRSRPTVRRLASDRFARRHREAGKAAFLAESESLGTPGVDQLEVGEITAPERVAEQLKLRKQSKVVRRDRRYLIDDIPVELATTYVPLTIARGTLITSRDTGPGGVYARIEEAGHRLASFTEEVGARMPTPDERRRLSLPEGTPVITVARVAYDVDSLPVEMTDTVKSAPSYVLEYSFPAT